MTPLTETINKVNGFNMGAADYITKPFEIHEVLSPVLERISRWLRSGKNSNNW